MKFVVRENERNPVKNLPRPRFVHHETHMEGPRRELGTPAVGGERLTACATRPPLSRFKVPNYVSRRIQCVYSSALCNFSNCPLISSLLAPNIFLSTLFSNTPNLCTSLKVRDQVSQKQTFISPSSSELPARGQVFHCKLRLQGRSSAQR